MNNFTQYHPIDIVLSTPNTYREVLEWCSSELPNCKWFTGPHLSSEPETLMVLYVGDKDFALIAKLRWGGA